MKKNLGQLLVEQGILSEKVLDEALQRQVIFGGRLGTNLLEMGAISEDDLMKILAFQLNVPYAEPRHFEKIPREVLDSLPRDLLSKHKIIPLALEGHRITLAMTDPHKLDVVDAVAFQTNMVIKPVIASEVRIFDALERYFGIKREARYIAVSEKVADEQRRNTVAEEEKKEETPVPAEEAEVLELTEEDMESYDPFDVSGINEPLFSIRSRDEVAQTVIRAGLRFMNDVFMFIIKDEEALGWMSGGSAKPVVDFGNLAVPLEPGSILSQVRESHVLTRAKGVEIFEGNLWIKELSLRVPREVVICPLVLKKQMVSVLVGFCFESPVTDDEAAFLVRVMKKASVAFEILIMKSRIIML
ncbi:MAG: hypothetical protein JSV70_01575 [bacterium]|nr:MAG: hypothetical protein JSV70_01575 [bacterium]